MSIYSQAVYEIACSEGLWRGHCLHRWQFCDIHQISDGSQRWRRYFFARIKVEKRMDEGRPIRDYRVKTLRKHEKDIIDIIILGGSNDNIENPKSHIVISLSDDSILYAWNTVEGIPVWSPDKPVMCIAGDNNNTVAIGDNTGHVMLYDTSDWSLKSTFVPPTANRMILAIKLVTLQVKKNDYSCLLISYSLDDNTGDIVLYDITTSKLIALLVCSTPSTSISIRGVWLAAAQETAGDVVFVWDLSDIIFGSPSSPPPSHSPHVTLHTNSCVHPLIWLQPGVLATGSVQLLPGPGPGPGLVPFPPGPGLIPFPPGFGIQGPIPRHRRIPNVQSNRSDLEIWNVMKHIKESKLNTSEVYRVTHMYDSTVITLDCVPSTIAYTNGLLIVGEDSGRVKVIDPSNGKCLQQFSDHKACVTDIYADNHRVLSCSKDFSIRVYRWIRDDEKKLNQSLPLLESKYQLLGGSVAMKTHDGFNHVLCDTGSCVGVAANLIKLYNFRHQI